MAESRELAAPIHDTSDNTCGPVMPRNRSHVLACSLRLDHRLQAAFYLVAGRWQPACPARATTCLLTKGRAEKGVRTAVIYCWQQQPWRPRTAPPLCRRQYQGQRAEAVVQPELAVPGNFYIGVFMGMRMAWLQEDFRPCLLAKWAKYSLNLSWQYGIAAQVAAQVGVDIMQSG